MIIEKYNDNYENIWDNFVDNESINGTIYHTRKFLNYHQKDRFEDVIYYIHNNWMAGNYGDDYAIRRISNYLNAR